MTKFNTRHTLWAICGCCNGDGSVDHPAFSNGITSQEMADMSQDWDAEGKTNGLDRYLSGAYDVGCNECAGSGKVRQPNFRAMARDERRAYVKHLRDERDEAAWMRESRAEYEAERRMGA
jgi:hypothetical protein